MDGGAARWPRWLPLVATLALVSYLLFTPAPEVPSNLPVSDKVVHAAMFAALAVSSRWAGVGARATALWLAGFAVASECLQSALPIGRTGSVGDVLADMAGVLVGLLVVEGLARRGARV